MCGICGQFNFAEEIPVRPETVKKMINTMVHRGPDDEGYHISGSLGLGFRRLSIIDLEGGHQPMSDQDNSVWVVLNGEIYNFPDLRKQLECLGYRFRTKADTEVILHGYKHWGNDVLEHLNGMFGLAIWDEKKRQLLLARDRMGIKPLYYRVEDGCLTFGSEIRSILALNGHRPEIDAVALSLFLRYRYTPSPLTIFEGISKLAPGTRLIVEGERIRVDRWWKYEPMPFNPMPSLEQAKDQLLELYGRAVKRQLRSDVPLGLLLSGGLDSGLLLALMQLNGTSWNTYTVGYGKSFHDDELSDAAETARTFGAHNASVEISKDLFQASLSEIISFLEEPVASASVVPMYHVCERARKDVKVALIGQGPDELFGGYKRHIGVQYGSMWRSLPTPVRNLLSAMLNAIPRNEPIKRALYSLNRPERVERYQQVFSIVPGQTIERLFRDGVLPTAPGDKILECWSDLIPLMQQTDELGGFQFLELRSSLPDELLMYTDKLSMAHGLEIRVPYLDHEIVEYVERLGSLFKVRNFTGKWVHRKVCKGFLPKEVMYRRKKGFAVNVVDEWFRHSLTKNLENTLLNRDSLMYDYINPTEVCRLLREHREGRDDNHKILFSLVVFETWLRNA
jgi:asparagine synthase (glutamine-hydrolysing)